MPAATTMETATALEAAAMEAAVEPSAKIAPVVSKAKPEAEPYGQTVSIIRICVPVIVRGVILVLSILPSLVSLTILRVIGVVAINGRGSLWRRRSS
jgi:hypothetical protein